MPMEPIMDASLFFLSVLADYLNGRPTTAPSPEPDWKAVLTLADHHEVRGILFYQCREYLPAPLQARMAQCYAADLYYFQNRIRLFSDVSTALQEASIPFFTVKGLDVAALYPVPALRTMGDCDIVVHSEDKERAHQVFLRLGFENKLKGSHEWIYFKQGMEFELHHRLLYDERGNTGVARRFCEDAWRYVSASGEGCALDWSFHAVFLLLHLHKHLIHSGVGFRQLMDLWVSLHHAPLNEPWMDAALEEMGLLAFSRRCVSLTEALFGGRTMTEADWGCLSHVLRNGIFGFHDEANLENSKLDALCQPSRTVWMNRLHLLMHCIFPPYEAMFDVPHYRGLEGRPWLLPLFWVYRWIRAVRYRMVDSGKRMLNDALISNQRINARRQELGLWGL